jgi:hypothetical protein
MVVRWAARDGAARGTGGAPAPPAMRYFGGVANAALPMLEYKSLILVQ